MDDLIDFIKIIGGFVLALAAGLFVVIGVPMLLFGSYAVKDIEKEAPTWLSSQGFKVVGHEGFTYGVFGQPGGCVWYVMKREDDPRVLYNGCVSKWHNGELQLYHTRALNAVSGH